MCVLDEVFHPGWRAALEAAWTDGTTQAVYRYTWNFNADGSEGTVFWIEKIHARRGYRWTHPVHEVLERQEGWGPGRKCTAEGVQLDHHADPAKSRGQYLPLLELSVAEAPEDDRNTHYLGREYLFYGRWDDCIRTLERHLSLPTAVWADERCASMRFLARAWRQKGRPEQARRWLWRAIGEAPHLREPYLELARLLYQLCPPALHGGLGILSGLCLGLCASYGFCTVFNCLGALLTASALFGPGPAAAIRVCNNVLGSLFGLFFALVWPWLLDALSRRRTAAARES